MSLGGQREFEESVRRGAAWLSGTGAEADVVISSRVRLARNLANMPFLSRASRKQRLDVLEIVRGRMNEQTLGGRVLWVDVHGAGAIDRTLMVERHLISKEHARGVVPGVIKGEGEDSESKTDPREEPRAVAITMPDESVSVMINEEDHLRLQVIQAGLELSKAFAQANAVDDGLPGQTPDGRVLEYAYSPRFGYLTACPTNVGTGIRVSVMLHLPALKLTGEIEKVRRATRDMSIAVRGYYGEGSEAAGEFYQVSNQTTLGKPESLILHEIEKEIVPQIAAYERAARRALLEKRRRTLEDKVFRSLGTLRGARLLTPEEAITMLSDVRLGIVSGVITDVQEQAVNQLILLTQPAHLQRALGVELDQQERREARADLVRGQLVGK